MNNPRLQRHAFVPDEEMLAEIKLLSKQGMRQVHLIDYFGISPSSWNTACKRQPEIMRAYRSGKSYGIKLVTSKLLEMAEKGNMRAIELYLKLIGKFSENYDPDEEKKTEAAPITFNVTDPIEAAKIYSQIMQGSK